MSIFGLFLAVFCLIMARSFSHQRLKSPANSKLCRGKITDLDDEMFTVEYTYQHRSYTYTTFKQDYYTLFGYRTDSHLTPEEARGLAEEARELNLLLKEGYSYDYYLRLHIGMKMLVWVEDGKPYHVLRVHNDNTAANKSAGRAFRAIGIFILLALAVIVASKFNR